MVGWLLAYNLSVGPLAYVIVGEASSTRLRNKTVAFSRASYNLFSIVFGTLSPYMLNKTAWGWEGKVGFFWAPICFLTALWAFFRLPEMRVSLSSYLLEPNADDMGRIDHTTKSTSFSRKGFQRGSSSRRWWTHGTRWPLVMS